jgi:hypothetical protein
MIINEWPAMTMVTAERVAPGDTIFGLRKNFKIELFDEWELVADVRPSATEQFKILIYSHGSDGVVGFMLMDSDHHVVIAKKGK